MKIGVISLGCAKNLVDTEMLLGMLRESGLDITTVRNKADVIIINTCGFIESAKSEAISTILEAADLKETGLKKLIVMGCLSQRYKPELEQEMPEVDRFISIDEYPHLNEILSEELGVPIPHTYGKSARMLSAKPWMAYLRIADGCDNRCSYCAIPLIRGPFVSREMKEIVEEARTLIQGGVKEITLIAQDCSRYGIDLTGRLMLSELVKELDALEGLHWLRILYLYPDEIPDDLLDTIRNSRHVLPYFDIPVQHGSDRILKAMHRRGSRALIEERCRKIRETFDHAVLRTTLIAGFPGETEADHAENISLLKAVKFDHMGAFAYSREEDTPAYDMEDLTSPEEKERRKEELMKVQSEISAELQKDFIGRTLEVLIERVDPLTEMYVGRAYMHAPDNVDGCVRFRGNDHRPGEFAMVEITRTAGLNLIGKEIEHA
ncbi:MAG: 30S ribosomal protein S12 methylthiotransferase RimO [Solobacterium sp.]|nr:30S ribosomal protein S12 methylthiotransferase RimO [Solobacterium sp.]